MTRQYVRNWPYALVCPSLKNYLKELIDEGFKIVQVVPHKEGFTEFLIILEK